MTDFDAIYVEDLSENLPHEGEAAEPIKIIIRGIGEITV